MTGERDSTGEADGRWSALAEWIHWRGLIRDVLFVTAWVAILSFGWGYMRWPAWAYYVVTFGGILAYSLTFDP